MKAILFALITVAGAVAFFQHHTLTALQHAEATAAEVLKSSAHEISDAPKGFSSPKAVLTDREMSAVLESVREFKLLVDTTKSRGAGISEKLTALNDALEKLSPEQIQSCVEIWTDGKPVTDELYKETWCFGNMIRALAELNPKGVLESVHPPFWSGQTAGLPCFQAAAAWYKQNPVEMIRWANEANLSPPAKTPCSRFLDVDEAVNSPSEPNVEKILRGGTTHWAITGLKTQEVRIAFLKSLHTVTKGECAVLEQIVSPLADRLPFSRLAVLGDCIPALKPSASEPKDHFGKAKQGTLRYRIAKAARSGTTRERWDWLTAREEDRPTEKMLSDMVQTWCGYNYPETAEWARSLPLGPERDKIHSEVLEFLKLNDAKDLANEWKAEQSAPR